MSLQYTPLRVLDAMIQNAQSERNKAAPLDSGASYWQGQADALRIYRSELVHMLSEKTLEDDAS